MRWVLRSEQDHQFVAGAADIACANGQDGIAGFGFAQQILDAFLHRAKVEHILVPRLANRFSECLAGYPGDSRLTGAVDVGEHQDVGEVEGAAEIVPEVLGAGIAVRLEQHQQTIVLAPTRSLERGADFGGMMAVIVNDCNVVDNAFDLEAAADSREFREALADQFSRDAEIEGDRRRRRGVADIVDDRRMRELEDTEILTFVREAELTAEPSELDAADYQIGLA
jgi:hypothetical protein